MRERLALPVLALLSTLTAFGAGLVWMTHMHHRGLRFIEPGAMEAYDSGYELLSDATVIPVGIAGVICTVAVLLLRPRGVPLWIPCTALALELTVFIARIGMWGSWAEEVREAGAVRLADGTFHSAYTQYMDTNWIRITLISTYALLALLMTLLAARGAARHARGVRLTKAAPTSPSVTTPPL